MKILVTGARGNIGKVLVPYLKSCGHETFGIDLQQYYADDYLTADINIPTDIVRPFAEFTPDIVIHMAAMVSRVTCEKSPALTMQTNITGTVNMAQLCKAYGAKLMSFSTSEIYGNIGGKLFEDRDDINPNNLYGKSKLIAESMVRALDVEHIIVRPFMFYHEDETTGAHRSAMIRFTYGLLHQQQIEVHKGSVRSWMHLDDAVQVIERLCHVKGNHTVNIGSPFAISTERMAAKICNQLGMDYDIYVKETNLPEKMTLTKYPDVSRQYELTSYECQISLSEGIARTIKTLREKP